MEPSPLASVCVPAPLPLPGGKYCKTAWSEVWRVRASPFWLSSLPARPWIVIHRSLSSAADFHLLNSQKAHETIAQFIKQKRSYESNASLLFKSYLCCFPLCREKKSPNFSPVLSVLSHTEGQVVCVCVDYNFKVWVISQFEKGRKMVKGILIENTKLIL